MNNEQALQVLKSTIDESIRKGVIPNMETAQQIIIALGIIAKAIQSEEK
jgi:hypothetical protein